MPRFNHTTNQLDNVGGIEISKDRELFVELPELILVGICVLCFCNCHVHVTIRSAKHRFKASLANLCLFVELAGADMYEG
mmetsp:Transcript_74117/g.174039  ORF Transcript_74117/g.174039 Transcript_74117/m.174039 type:complete len:80 (+) Transcript_74117:773-1012(+)